ncbi:chromate efflux transporter [Trinickia violacea]|uniref:Chromate efflux transporter n=1 Tax=Trinickia violacea TaxID=2571746 RepID=A0A4P8IZ70_9BURK|nr:chromate efflux transporter [Trinickia violacea]QCP52574.1 chromate efflux transporter [Trinickia violacea]
MQTELIPYPQRQQQRSALTVLIVFLKLGLTSFGGPIAHLGYFRRQFVERLGWLDEESFTDLVALCQLLPGPASSQVGFSIGLLRAGWLGGLAAWCGFTLPSVALLLGFAAIAPDLNGTLGAGLIHGLKLVAVAVVAQAVWDMAKRLCPDLTRAAIALFALAAASVLTNAYGQLTVIAFGAALGLALCRPASSDAARLRPLGAEEFPISHKVALLALAAFFALLLALPAIAAIYPSHTLAVFDAFYRSGALVFGGGHVVLPLLQEQTVATGWVAPSDFLSGYGAAQAVPGPLFTFAAFLGWRMLAAPHHWAGAWLATAGIFLPGLLLVLGTLPYWRRLRASAPLTAVLSGTNAAVVGLLGAALYSPVWTSAVVTKIDFVVAAIGFCLLTRWKAPPLVVVVFCVAAALIESMWK